MVIQKICFPNVKRGPGPWGPCCGIMKFLKYILNENLANGQWLHLLAGQWYIKKGSKSKQKGVNDHRINLLTWPSQFSELHSIERQEHGIFGQIPYSVTSNLIKHYIWRLKVSKARIAIIVIWFFII